MQLRRNRQDRQENKQRTDAWNDRHLRIKRCILPLAGKAKIRGQISSGVGKSAACCVERQKRGDVIGVIEGRAAADPETSKSQQERRQAVRCFHPRCLWIPQDGSLYHSSLQNDNEILRIIRTNTHNRVQKAVRC